MKNLIGVIGAGDCSDDIYELATEVGRQIALTGFGLVCGGLFGVMEAAAKGCKQENGLTVGIIPQESLNEANPYIDIVIPSGMGIMRNLLVVRSSVGIIAVDGRYGTLSEIAYALQLKKPLVGLNSWEITEDFENVVTPKLAIESLLRKINK